MKRLNNFNLLILTDRRILYRGPRGAGARECDCDATVVGLILIRKNKLLFVNIVISSLFHQGNSSVLSSAIEHAMLANFGEK